MFKKIDRNANRQKRHNRIRFKVSGTPQRPRLNVFRANSNMYAQIVDDVNGVTLVSASTTEANNKIANGGNVEAAKQVGEAIATRALEKGIDSVVFDRGGYLYHGRVKALAEAARAKGLNF